MKKYTIEQFMDIESIFGGSFSSDESDIMFSSNRSGIYNLYSQNLRTKKISTVTKSKTDPILGGSYFPNDNRVLFCKDSAGNELTHIYLQDNNGEQIDLTPFDNSRNEFLIWAYNQKSFYYITNKRDKKFFDLYQVFINNMSEQVIYKNEQFKQPVSVSRNGKYLALEKSNNRYDSNLFLYNVETKEEILIDQKLTGEKNNNRFACFSPDSESLYYITDKDEDYQYLVQYYFKEKKYLIIKQYNWDISYFSFSYSGRYNLTVINENASTRIIIYDLENERDLEITNLPSGDLIQASFSKSDNLMAFYMGNSKMPRDLYVYDIEKQSCHKLTNSLCEDIESSDLVRAKDVVFKSFDDLDIPALLYIPRQTKDEKVPALIFVHGGPGGQSRKIYNGKIQYLVNQGYAILAVNNRGSSGYGKYFFNLDQKKHGNHDLDDCVYGKKYLEELDLIDSERIGIMGGSYGGYITLAALAFRPNQFKIGIDIFGVSNWLRTLKMMPDWWEAIKEELYQHIGNPETEEDYLKSISPLFHSDKIQKPLFVIQGKNDPRVLKIESDEIVDKVKENNVPVEYLVFEEEGHGFYNKQNEITCYNRIYNFLIKYL